MKTPEHNRSVKSGANSDNVKTGSDISNNANEALVQGNAYKHEVSQSQPNK